MTEEASSLSRRDFQLAFFKRMGALQQFRLLLECLPDVDYFAKDVEGRYMVISPGILRRIGVKSEDDILGACDSIMHPPRVARAIRMDDLHVMQTRETIEVQVEALYIQPGPGELFVINKLPVIGANDEVIGVMGIVRPLTSEADQGSQNLPLKRVVAYIREHHQRRLAMAELIKVAHLSERQINRKFHETYRMSAQEFIIRTRILAAAVDLLETSRPVAEIALDHGFYDQSAFCKHFRMHMGETPLGYRKLHRQTSGA